MTPTYKVAVVQLYPEHMQIDSNHAKAIQFIKTAASNGAQLVVLPEYHLTSWAPDHPDFIPACSQWQRYLDAYKSLARTLNICIVPGTIVEWHQDATTAEEKLINVAYFIDNTGKVLGSYQKKNLWHPERPHLKSSFHDPHTVIQTPLGPVGLLICWDLAFPEAFRELIAQGAKTIIIPAFWNKSDGAPSALALNPNSEALFIRSTLVSRAYENTAAVIFVNAGGAHASPALNSYIGLSCVTLPFVGALGTDTKDRAEEGMSMVDVDMQILEDAEKHYKVREDITGKDWHYSYRHSLRAPT